MLKGCRLIVIAPCLNEKQNIGEVVRRTRAIGIVDEVLVVDDASDDGSSIAAAQAGATLLQLPHRSGVGAALRAGFEFAANRCDIIVVIAGNNKDEPQEIERLVTPIADDRADFVQGSRYLTPGGCRGDMPFYRKVATRLHPWLFGVVTGTKLSESTNGFRAFRSSLLAAPGFRLRQTWLNRYELEPYFLYKVITLGYRWLEVPVTKTYPRRGLTYTKMRPVSDWWSLLRPLFLLPLRLKK